VHVSARPLLEKEQCADPTASLRPFAPGEEEAAKTPALDRVRERGRLVVGLDTARNLMSLRDPITSELLGLEVDIAREIADDLLGSPEAVEFRQLDSTEVLPAVSEGEVDIALDSLSITCARRLSIEFSAEYLRTPVRLMVNPGSEIDRLADLSGRWVCATTSSASLPYMAQVPRDAYIMGVPRWSDCLVALQQHHAEAVIADTTVLAGFSGQDPYVQIVGPALGEDVFAAGIPPSDKDMVRFVNGTIARLVQSGRWEELCEQWLGKAGAPPEPNYRD
jgi:polar amino acid transport system substrate-binding protein